MKDTTGAIVVIRTTRTSKEVFQFQLSHGRKFSHCCLCDIAKYSAACKACYTQSLCNKGLNGWFNYEKTQRSNNDK